MLNSHKNFLLHTSAFSGLAQRCWTTGPNPVVGVTLMLPDSRKVSRVAGKAGGNYRRDDITPLSVSMSSTFKGIHNWLTLWLVERLHDAVNEL